MGSSKNAAEDQPISPGRLGRFAGRLTRLLGNDAAFAVVLLLLGVAAGAVIAEPWASSAPPLKQIRIDGVPVPTGPARPEALVRLARARLRAPVTLRAAGFTRRTDWAALGAGVDLGSLDRILAAAAEPGSGAARYFQENAPDDSVPSIPLPVALDAGRAVEALAALKASVDRKPRNARFDFARGTVVPEQPGLRLDLYATLEQLDAALSRRAEEVPIALDPLPAEVSARELAEIRTAEVIGFFETPISRMAKDEDRTYNVKLGASLLNGQIIMPGKSLSFNAAVGDRTEALGFRYAPVIAGGTLVEGMGGGTCQLASTLNAAAFFAGLVVVERKPHSRPSSYIKLGLDATVSYPDLDLKLKNPFSFPVVVHATVDEATLRVEIRGQERPYTVTFLRKIIGKKPFAVTQVEDPNLEKGREVITQNGIPGYLVRRYQIIEQNKTAYRFQTVDKYPPTTQIVHAGTAPRGSLRKDNPDAPKPDSHDPYREVANLRMVQGPDGLWYEQSHE